MNKNQSQPQRPFQEPDLTSFDDFITYCSIFDPAVSSGTVIDNNGRIAYKSLAGKLVVRYFNNFLGINLHDEQGFVIFVCHAPIYFENPKEYSINTSWEDLKKSQVHSQKTYACFRGVLENNKISQRWLVIKTPTEDVEYNDYWKNMMGYGKSLLEADLEFHKAQIINFANLQNKGFEKIFSWKIPFTKQQMFDLCKKFDPGIDPNTVTFSYPDEILPFSSYHPDFLPDNINVVLENIDIAFKFLCKSENRLFTFKLTTDFKPSWEVVRLVAINAEIDDPTFGPRNIIFRHKFRGLSSYKLEDAFKESEREYQEFTKDKETLNQRISSILEERRKEGELKDSAAFHEQLKEWYGGEDNFPDRD